MDAVNVTRYTNTCYLLLNISGFCIRYICEGNRFGSRAMSQEGHTKVEYDYISNNTAMQRNLWRIYGFYGVFRSIYLCIYSTHKS